LLCHVTLTYYFELLFTKPFNEKRVFRCVLSIFEKTFRDSKITSVDSYWESWCGFSKDTKVSLNLTLPFIWGQRNAKLTKNWIFFVQIINLCCEVFPINNFQY